MTPATRITREPGSQVSIESTTYSYVKTFKDDFFAESHLLAAAGRLYVLKISRIRFLSGIGTGFAARYMARREREIYSQVDGVEGVPPLVGKAGDSGFIHEYVPGETLDSREDVNDLFFDRLIETVRAIHGRGVAYVDLSKKENIIVGDDRRPYLIDFQISMRKSERRGPLAALYNLAVDHMMKEDIAHALKHKRRVRPDLLSEEERAASRRKSIWNKLHKHLLRRPFLAFKRTFIAPKHGSV